MDKNFIRKYGPLVTREKFLEHGIYYKEKYPEYKAFMEKYLPDKFSYLNTEFIDCWDEPGAMEEDAWKKEIPIEELRLGTEEGAVYTFKVLKKEGYTLVICMEDRTSIPDTEEQIKDGESNECIREYTDIYVHE